MYARRSRPSTRQQAEPFEPRPKKRSGLPEYQLDIGLAEAGSFGFKVILTQKSNQQLSLLAPQPEQVLKTVIDSISNLGNGDEESIIRRFNDDEYSTNFIAQAKTLLPDGETIGDVSFIGANREHFTITKTKSEFRNELRDKNKYGDKNIRRKNAEIIHEGYLRVSNG